MRPRPDHVSFVTGSRYFTLTSRAPLTSLLFVFAPWTNGVAAPVWAPLAHALDRRCSSGDADEVVVGEQGEVTGMVAAQHVIVRGKVSGIVCGMMVSLQSSARVNGDIHHMSLTIEQGAEFEGRSRRPSDPSELDLVVDARAAIDAKVA
jgi:hypothetical protein